MDLTGLLKVYVLKAVSHGDDIEKLWDKLLNLGGKGHVGGLKVIRTGP